MSRRYWGSIQSGPSACITRSRVRGAAGVPSVRDPLTRAPPVPSGRGRAAGGRGRPLARPVAGGRALGPRAAARRRPAQRRRPLPLLAHGCRRRRPRHPSPPVPRRRRELGARLQHRLRRPHRQRLQRRGLPRRRPPAVEPAGRHGHRPLPARAPPPVVDDLVAWAASAGRRAPASPSSASTTCPGRWRWRRYDLPRACVLVLGQEGPGLTPEMQAACDVVLHVEQFGSTRSINAGAAAAIAMHAWVRRHVFGQHPT